MPFKIPPYPVLPPPASKNYVSVGPLTLTFTQDTLVNSVNLTTIDNNIVEETKDLSLALSTSDPAVVLSPSSAGVKITDTSSKCSSMELCLFLS